MITEISMAEALKMCMDKGMTRRQAKRFLLKHLRAGRIRSFGNIGDGRAQLDAKFWQGPWTDDEGDGDQG